ncbi:MAG: hypothetical protein KKI02_04490 [Planctomycetes bacterium]|nr:hypothetical protein [Planctomycetota bacterium]
MSTSRQGIWLSRAFLSASDLVWFLLFLLLLILILLPYTLQTEYTRKSALIGTVPGPEETLGPLTQTDSFLVP